MLNIDQAMVSPEGWKTKKSKPKYAQAPDDQAPEFPPDWKQKRSMAGPANQQSEYEEEESSGSDSGKANENYDKTDDAKKSSAGPASLKGEKWKFWSSSPYEVSNMGRVRRDEKILKPRANPAGFLYVHASYDGKIEQPALHRMVLEAFGHKPPKGVKNPVVAHKNNKKNDNRLENLRWASTSDNTEDAYDDALYEEKGANNSDWIKKNGKNGEKKADKSHQDKYN